MSGYLIDTDWVVDVLHGQQGAINTLVELAPQGLAMSLISYGELYEGAYYARDRQAAIAALADFVEGIDILPLTPEILRRFAVLRGSLSKPARQQIGDLDLLIASTAFDAGLTVLTRNLKDFQLVPDLPLYQRS